MPAPVLETACLPLEQSLSLPRTVTTTNDFASVTTNNYAGVNAQMTITAKTAGAAYDGVKVNFVNDDDITAGAGEYLVYNSDTKGVEHLHRRWQQHRQPHYFQALALRPMPMSPPCSPSRPSEPVVQLSILPMSAGPPAAVSRKAARLPASTSWTTTTKAMSSVPPA